MGDIFFVHIMNVNLSIRRKMQKFLMKSVQKWHKSCFIWISAGNFWKTGLPTILM